METVDNVSSRTNSELLFGFYLSIGMPEDISVSEWLLGCSMKQYPMHESVVRAIRKARELRPEWRKKDKQKEVDHVKEEVGYRRRG
jgi:hypothetical protein